MIYVAASAIAAFLAMLHMSAMPYVEVLGVTPDFLLVFASCFAVLRREEEALIVVPLAGLMRDLTTNDPIGTSILGFAPIVLLAAATRMRAMDSQFIPAVVVCFAGTITYAGITMAVLAATGQEIQWTDSVLRFALPLGVVNALFTPVFYIPMSRFRPPVISRAPIPRRVGAPL
jgi:rod shape-determining protein MreD